MVRPACLPEPLGYAHSPLSCFFGWVCYKKTLEPQSLPARLAYPPPPPPPSDTLFPNQAHRIQRKIQEGGLQDVPGPPARSSLASLVAPPAAAGRPPPQSSLLGVVRPPAHTQQASSSLSRLLGGTSLPPPSAAFSQAPRQGGALANLMNPKPQAPLPVRMDDEFMPGQGHHTPLPGYVTMPQTNNLKELKPFGVIRKENTDKAGPWAGVTLPQGRAFAPVASLGSIPGSGSGSGGQLEICVDDEFQEEERPAGGRQQAGSPSFRRATEPAAAQRGDACRAGPSAALPPPSSLLSLLEQPRAPVRPPASTGPQQRLQPNGPAAQPPQGMLAAAAGATVGRQAPIPSVNGDISHGTRTPTLAQDGVDMSLLTSSTGEELSFEEVRASVFRTRSQGAGASVAPAATQQGPAAAAAILVQQRRQPQLQPQPVMAMPLPASSQTGSSNSSNNMAAPPPPVMLSSSLRASLGLPSSTDQASPAHLPPTTAPLPAVADPSLVQLAAAAGKPAPKPFQRIDSGGGAACSNSLLGAGQPAVVTAPAPRGASSSYMPEPTVTISTRHAFDAINSMFSDMDAGQEERGGAGPSLQSKVGGGQPQQQAGHAAEQKQQQVQLSGQRQQQQMVQHPEQQQQQASERLQPDPSVTMSTKEAFDVLNSMFSDVLPHEGMRGGRQRVSQGGSGGAQYPTNPQIPKTQQTHKSLKPITWGARLLYAVRSLWHLCMYMEHDGQLHTPACVMTCTSISDRHLICCTPLSQGGGGSTTLVGPPAGAKCIRASDVCRLANSSKAAAGNSFSARPAAAASSTRMHSEVAGFGAPEDTTDFSTHATLGGLGMLQSGGRGGGVYEDTDFIMRPIQGTAGQGAVTGGGRGGRWSVRGLQRFAGWEGCEAWWARGQGRGSIHHPLGGANWLPRKGGPAYACHANNGHCELRPGGVGQSYGEGT